MPIDGIQAAVSGLKAAQKKQNQSAHNVANVSTPGYQPKRVNQATLANGGVQTVGTSFTGSVGSFSLSDPPPGPGHQRRRLFRAG